MDLIKEKWIPTDIGLLSLEEVFQSNALSLSTDAQGKIALLRLFVAIVTAGLEEQGLTWGTGGDLSDLGVEGVCSSALKYLSTRLDRFNLYGDRPFLQTPASVFPTPKKEQDKYPIGRLREFYSEGSNALFRDEQRAGSLTDAEKALGLLVTQVFSPGYKKGKGLVAYGKAVQLLIAPSTPQFARGGGSFARGVQHIMLEGSSLAETIFLNVIHKEAVLRVYPKGLGIPYWEHDNRVSAYPESSYDTYFDRMIPASYKFVRIENEYLIYAGSRLSGVWPREGLYHYSDATTVPDPSDSKKRIPGEELHACPNAGSFWRELGAFLAVSVTGELHLMDEDKLSAFDSVKVLSMGVSSVQESMGLYMTKSLEDSSEVIPLNSRAQKELRILYSRGVRYAYNLEKSLRGAVRSYCTSLNIDPKKGSAKYADSVVELFWLMLSKRKGDLRDGVSSKDLGSWKKKIRETALEAYQNLPGSNFRDRSAIARGSLYIKRKKL